MCAAKSTGELAAGEVYSVVELAFRGPMCGPQDAPARDVAFQVVFEHEEGRLSHGVHGFYDGDGRGGRSGDVFKVRVRRARFPRRHVGVHPVVDVEAGYPGGPSLRSPMQLR
jgi:hypothetical protein